MIGRLRRIRRRVRRRRWRRKAIRRYRRLLRRMAGTRLLKVFAASYPNATFVEIGANDGAQFDHLREHIRSREWTGLMVEPVPYVFERLVRNYADVPRVTLVNAAVSSGDGTLPFFHLRAAPQHDGGRVPSWYDAIGSLSREVVLSHARQIPGVARRLVEREVEALTFATLCKRHGLEQVDLVVIDTEGHDWEILRTIDLARHRPRLVVYEHFHLSPSDRAAAREHMLRAGYETMEEGLDTFCLRPEPDDKLLKAWRSATPAVPGATKAEEEHDLPLADRSVPLPDGAEQELRDDNPRLAELRAAYAALDISATAASRWSAERVAGFLDLRWFRGESLITWHYRSTPEETERRYRALLDHVAARDRLGMLGRVEEDGLFGCWTFAFPGRPRVSRDLLDSINELSFLARAGFAEPDGLRVLDIGAGYGRLAHRAARGLPNLADWCCVDGVPEATFLSDYYLRFRGVVPPARVVGLHEIDTLRPGDFDLAVNVHSFPEMPLAAARWWIERLAHLRVPALFVVPNGPGPFASLEPDGSRLELAPVLTAAGYALVRDEPAIDDPEVDELLGVHDRFHLYLLR